MKICSGCNETKALSEFYKRSRAKDGLQSRCKVCCNSSSKEWAKANPEAIKKIQKNYHESNVDARRASARARAVVNREKRIESALKWVGANPEKHLANMRAYYSRNPDEFRARHKKWIAENRDRANAHRANYRAAKLKATPAWANDELIKEYYFAADFLGMVTGIWHHVDHIVPLQSDLVCGLHWEQNLQVLPASENLSKSNRYWPDMAGVK